MKQTFNCVTNVLTVAFYLEIFSQTQNPENSDEATGVRGRG